MFERYTEKARRVIFFARYEASVIGSPEIGDEHVLLGLMREGEDLLRRHLGEGFVAQELRDAIMAATVVRESTPTNIDLPLTWEAKRILAYSAEEAMRLGHPHIGTEHLLLGILREEECVAARLLRERGLTIPQARTLVGSAGAEGSGQPPFSGSGSGLEVKSSVGSGGGSKQSEGNTGMAIRFVAEGVSEPLLVSDAAPIVPRIGEGIVLREAGRDERRYRVVDVIWSHHRDASGSLNSEVEVRLIREEPSAGE